MKYRILSLLLALLLFAGCTNGAGSSQASSSGPYENKNPEMVLAKLPNGDIPYGDYRLYIDVTEQLNIDQAKLYLGQMTMMERDLASYGVALNEEEIATAGEASVSQIRSDPGNARFLALLVKDTSLTDEDVNAALKTDARVSYLYQQLMQYFDTEAAQPAEEPDAASGPESSAPEGSDSSDASEPATEKDALALWTEYYQSLNTRVTSADDASKLCLIDGSPVDISPDQEKYIAYQAVYTRVALADEISTSVAITRELEAQEADLAWDEFDAYKENYFTSLEANVELSASLDRSLAAKNATREQFYESFGEYLKLQYAGEKFYTVIGAEYDALSEEEKAVTDVNAFLDSRLDALVADLEIVNPMGK